jgi:hypothetical protein
VSEADSGPIQHSSHLHRPVKSWQIAGEIARPMTRPSAGFAVSVLDERNPWSPIETAWVRRSGSPTSSAGE